MSHTLPTIDILGVPIARLTPKEAIAAVERLYDNAEPAFVVHANAHTLNLAYEDPGFLNVLRRADLVLNDGKGVMLAARIHGHRFPRDLNGNFFAPLLLRKAADNGWRVFFLGAGPGVAERAAATLHERIPGLHVVGTLDGYFDSNDRAIDAIKQSGAEVLLVGMGNPLQEKWIDRCLDRTGARVAIGVGAFFDFVTGEVPRAPEWMNRFGLEWVHRLLQEPKRMWRRYLLGNPKFVWRNLKQRFT
ncbi:MAG: WecB/TagA/CpsF family glycosyltransferase [Actinobacteria bacterium]|nr:WecB/TagA/CpsF family glycosyltransferase [Actinomycetota bacterium]